MKTTLLYPSWHDIEKGVAKISNEMLKSNYNPDFIVAVARGGLIPATLMSHILDIPLLPVSFSSKDGNGDNKNHENELPTIQGDFKFPPKILIVDDICDSGKTLYELYEYYASRGHAVRTASLYFKYHPTEQQIFEPDFYWNVTIAGDPWINFPWEM